MFKIVLLPLKVKTPSNANPNFLESWFKTKKSAIPCSRCSALNPGELRTTETGFPPKKETFKMGCPFEKSKLLFTSKILTEPDSGLSCSGLI